MLKPKLKSLPKFSHLPPRSHVFTLHDTLDLIATMKPKGETVQVICFGKASRQCAKILHNGHNITYNVAAILALPMVTTWGGTTDAIAITDISHVRFILTQAFLELGRNVSVQAC